MKKLLLAICFCFISSNVLAEIQCEFEQYLNLTKEDKPFLGQPNNKCVLDFSSIKKGWEERKGVKIEKAEVCMKLLLTNGERIKGTNIWKDKSNPSKLYYIKKKGKDGKIEVDDCKSMNIKFKTKSTKTKVKVR